MAWTEEQRAAARIRGCLGSRTEVVPGGLVLWTEEGAGEWKAGAEELRDDLTLLGVPHYATLTGQRQPPWRAGRPGRHPAVRWVRIWVTGAGFTRLAEAVPLAAQLNVPPAHPDPDVAIIRQGDGSAAAAIGGELLLWDTRQPEPERPPASGPLMDPVECSCCHRHADIRTTTMVGAEFTWCAECRPQADMAEIQVLLMDGWRLPETCPHKLTPGGLTVAVLADPRVHHWRR